MMTKIMKKKSAKKAPNPDHAVKVAMISKIVGKKANWPKEMVMANRILNKYDYEKGFWFYFEPSKQIPSLAILMAGHLDGELKQGYKDFKEEKEKDKFLDKPKNFKIGNEKVGEDRKIKKPLSFKDFLKDK